MRNEELYLSLVRPPILKPETGIVEAEVIYPGEEEITTIVRKNVEEFTYRCCGEYPDFPNYRLIKLSYTYKDGTKEDIEVMALFKVKYDEFEINKGNEILKVGYTNCLRHSISKVLRNEVPNYEDYKVSVSWNQSSCVIRENLKYFAFLLNWEGEKLFPTIIDYDTKPLDRTPDSDWIALATIYENDKVIAINHILNGVFMTEEEAERRRNAPIKRRRRRR